ncbi:MAG TPA: neuraminidase-like domain-containing protein, partial [Chitinophagaceae bacterium]|nr:neuraminidase-like domain-containing protein [Chitinophagaceae bacterium]
LINLATDKLNLVNLSVIYRYVVLAKALKFKVPDFCLLLELMNASPFSTWNHQTSLYTQISPAATVSFCKLATAVKQTGFKPATLQYIFTGELPADSNLGLPAEKVYKAVKAIREIFAAIEQDHPDVPATPLTADMLRSKLSLTFRPETVNQLIAIIEGTVTADVLTTANLAIAIPSALSPKYSYTKASGRLSCTGIMTDAEKTTLLTLNAAVAYTDAVNALYKSQEDFLTANFSGVFVANMPAAFITLLDHPAQATAAAQEEKFKLVYDNYLPLLKQKLREDAITQHIAALTGLSDEAAKLLSATDINNLITDLAKEGFSATYYSDATWTTHVLERIDSEINFNWVAGSPDAAVPANNFSVKWEAYLTPPASGEYTLIAAVDGADEAFKLYIDDVLVLEKPAANATLSWEVLASLNASQMHQLRLEYAETSGNAAVTLSWKTATTAAEVIPASALFPAKITNAFSATATIYHRAARFITGFKLDETELDHFITYKADFANIDFKALTATHWSRISDYTVLRNAIPQAQATLTDVFKLANSTNPVPTVNELRDLLAQATAWDSTSLDYFINTHFTLPLASFKNEMDLTLLSDAIRIVAKTGIGASTIAEWGKAETDFDKLYATAQLIKSTVKAKYEEEDWLDVAGKLSDKIRENQKQALISHLLTRQDIIDWGAKDADGLFEYFLIDVQMGTCMETSRIVQANAAVQQFVNRCLLNMESDRRTGSEKGVSPEAIDADRWEWMKNYRVWEANRKVFLYPENWLEPEWRNDRSEIFKALESELVQNDITDRSVETAFRNYLGSLNEVANLDVVGMYQENDTDGSLKLLHVFGRTHNAPYTVYYRTWNEYMKWSAWEKVQVDVRNVEEGDNSGVHLVPVVWKNRLFLFWPEFIEKKENPAGNKTQTATELSKKATSTLEAYTTWEVRLAWTEKVEGKWTPKQLSKEFIFTYRPDDTTFSDFSFTTSINEATNELSISMWSLLPFAEIAHFLLTDIQSKVAVEYPGYIAFIIVPVGAYDNSFEKRIKNDKLKLKDDTYLNKVVNHRLLGANNEPGFEYAIANPFFYHDALRTYFVRPVDITILERVTSPDIFYPVIPGVFVDDSWYTQPHFPEIGPDDYMPGTILPGGGYTDPVRFTFGNYGVGELHYNPKATAGGQSVMGGMLPGTSVPFNGNTTGGAMPRTMMMRSMNNPAAPQAGGANILGTQYPYMEKYKPGKLGKAFDKYHIADRYKGYWKTRKDTGLEFHTFYHPYSTEYVTRLNRYGVKGMLESDTVLPSDEGDTFVTNYNPVFTSGLVQKPADFSTRTYFKQNVCFDVYGANSLYNWELFFHAPLYIAIRLSKNGRYEEAMKWFHYIFDPTTDELPLAGQSETSRYWKVLPFKTTPSTSLEEFFLGLTPNNNRTVENQQIGEWRDNPFDPHLVASNRPLAYMKNVVIKYVENLLEWGDFLFRQFTRESVNEALQLYVIANHILGPRPEFVP